jgi:hypothetical protein
MVGSHLILALFLVTQAFDGLFTYTAVRADGLQAEGNILLATWMALVGPASAVVGAKLLAAGCGLLLYKHGVHRTLALLTFFYLVAAVGPWILLIRQY